MAKYHFPKWRAKLARFVCKPLNRTNFSLTSPAADNHASLSLPYVAQIPKPIFPETLVGSQRRARNDCRALTAWTREANLVVPSATDELLRHVKFLSAAELTGRGVDTPGIKLARDYIAAEFAKSGLKPGGDNGSFLQSFDVAVGVSVTEPSSLALGRNRPLELNTQWIPLGLSTSDKVQAPMVFAGYGITAKEYGYDDYAGIDVKGKIVLVLRYEPPPKSDASPFRKFPNYSSHAALRSKANNARAHGAVGMILVDLNNSGDEKTELLSTAE